MPVRSGIDTGRLAAAVQRPGIDPRLWLTFAIVRDVAYDAEHGMFADVQLCPDGDIETCIVGSGYAGDGFGEWMPLKVDDVVLVAIPNGDPGTGPIIVSRLFSGSEKPPSDFKHPSSSEAMDAANDPIIRVEDGASLRIIAKEGANIKLEVTGAGKVAISAKGNATVEVTGEKAIVINSPDVRIGDTAGQPVARVGDLVVVSVPPMVVPLPSPASPTPVIPVPPVTLTTAGGIPAVGQIVSGKTGVKA